MAYEFAYNDIEDATALHRQVARWIVFGKTYKEISEVEGITPGHVASIAVHPPIVQEITRIKFKEATNLVAVAERFAGLVPNAISAVEKVLNPETSASNKDLLSAAAMVFDREPSGRLTKVTRHEHTDIKVIDSRAIENIKVLATNLGRPAKIEIGEFSIVEELPEEEQQPDWLINWQEVSEWRLNDR